MQGMLFKVSGIDQKMNYSDLMFPKVKEVIVPKLIQVQQVIVEEIPEVKVAEESQAVWHIDLAPETEVEQIAEPDLEPEVSTKFNGKKNVKR